MPLIEGLYRVLRPQVEAWCAVILVKEYLNIFLQVEQVLVLSDVLTFMIEDILWIRDGWSCLSPEK